MARPRVLSRPIDPMAVKMAVTCSAQSTYLTGLSPSEHGIVGNGWYNRELAEVQFVPHGVQAHLVHTEDIVQGAVGDPMLALEQCHHRQEHRVELALGLSLRTGVGCCGGDARPDEDRTLLIHRQALALNELVGERL